MNINSVGNYSQVQKVSFGNGEDVDYKKALELAKKMNSDYVPTEDIKTPQQVVASVGFAGVKTFLNAATTTVVIDKIFKGKISNGIAKGITGLSDKMLNASNILKTDAVSVKAKGKNVISKLLSKTAEQIKKSKMSLPIAVGIGAIIALVPSICSRDNNGDGVKDIAQKSQSAYETFEKKTSGLVHEATDVAQFLQIFS